MSDNELLLAISEMLDKKLESNLKPVENRLRRIELQLENDVIPRIRNIESCYTDNTDAIRIMRIKCKRPLTI